MKLLAVAALVLATTACTAQQSPVGIAVEIYKGCMVGLTMNRFPLPTKPKEINELATELDGFCTTWTYAWTPAMLHQDRGALRPDELLRFDQYRRGLLKAYISELKQMPK